MDNSNKSKNETALDYYYENKTRMRKEQNAYKKTYKGIKSNRMSRWKAKGLILEKGQTYEDIWNIVESVDLCMCCGGEFGSSGLAQKCMDHSHITGFFRSVLCGRCNLFNLYDADFYLY
jgi:hypothetical protein